MFFVSKFIFLCLFAILNRKYLDFILNLHFCLMKVYTSGIFTYGIIIYGSAQVVECPFRGTGGHGFDPGPRHIKVVKMVR